MSDEEICRNSVNDRSYDLIVSEMAILQQLRALLISVTAMFGNVIAQRTALGRTSC